MLGTVAIPISIAAMVVFAGWLLASAGEIAPDKGVGVTIWQLALILGISAVAWWVVSWVVVWRCAPNCAWRGSLYIARGLVLAHIAWLLAGVLQLGGKYYEAFS